MKEFFMERIKEIELILGREKSIPRVGLSAWRYPFTLKTYFLNIEIYKSVSGETYHPRFI